MECIFGILKKRFLFLKNPIRLHDPKQIERIMVTCAVIHNLLHEYDGVDDLAEADVVVEYNGLEEVGEWVARGGRNHNGVAGVRSQNRDIYGVGDTDEYQYTNEIEERAEFVERRDSLIEHYAYLREQTITL